AGTPPEARAGACCSQTTRWRAVTARPIARMCARWGWRRRGRSFDCARWRPPGYLNGGPDMAPVYFSEVGYAPLALLRLAFGASRQSRDARLRDVPLTDFPRSPVPATRRSRDRAAVPRSGSRADSR